MNFPKTVSCSQEAKSLYIESVQNNLEFSNYYLGLFYSLESSVKNLICNISEIHSVYLGVKDENTIQRVLILKLLVLETKKHKKTHLDSFLKAEASELKDEIQNLELLDVFMDFLQSNEFDFDYLKGKERLLIETLISSPKEKYDLIEAVYGSNCDILKAEKSFKVLLSRVRKKIHCDLILGTCGQYQLQQ